MDNSIRVERNGVNGFETKDMSISEALSTLNNDIQNEMTVWIDSKPFMEDVITEEDILKCKKEISVTNKLVGG